MISYAVFAGLFVTLLILVGIAMGLHIMFPEPSVEIRKADRVVVRQWDTPENEQTVAVSWEGGSYETGRVTRFTFDPLKPVEDVIVTYPDDAHTVLSGAAAVLERLKDVRVNELPVVSTTDDGCVSISERQTEPEKTTDDGGSAEERVRCSVRGPTVGSPNEPAEEDSELSDDDSAGAESTSSEGDS